MSFVWLAVFLTPVGSLLERDPDPGAPISNIRVDPRRGRVVWDLNGSVAEVTCSTGSVYLSKADNTTTYCQFYAFLLCKTTNYTITVTSGPPFSTVIQYPKPDGKPGAAAENLTCWIHDVDFLECSWAVGKAAPWDVQYHLYLIETPNYEEWHVALHYGYAGNTYRLSFRHISKLKNHHHHFVVNGTSEGFIIPCTEIFATLSEIGHGSHPPKHAIPVSQAPGVGTTQPSAILQRRCFYLQIWRKGNQNSDDPSKSIGSGCYCLSGAVGKG
nr:interleukin-3 receptor subunit alpha isoform X4 [Loxodonta africana]